MNEELVKQIIKSMKKSGLTLSVAESITGGGLAAAITDVAGSSSIFLGGLVTYSDQSKIKFLDVPKRTLTKESPVSESVAILMAENVRKNFGSDYGVATTGVAGPGKAYGQSAGRAWIAIASKKKTISVELALSGDREAVRNATIQSALALLSRTLLL